MPIRRVIDHRTVARWARSRTGRLESIARGALLGRPLSGRPDVGGDRGGLAWTVQRQQPRGEDLADRSEVGPALLIERIARELARDVDDPQVHLVREGRRQRRVRGAELVVLLA